MTATAKQHKDIMADMATFDEPMPSVGIFWYDPADHTFFGVGKKELTPKMIEDAADKGLPYINYPTLHRQVWAKEECLGRVAWAVNKFVVFVGQLAKDIEPELTELIEKEFALPYFEFLYDEHWDLGHGWSGDFK